MHDDRATVPEAREEGCPRSRFRSRFLAFVQPSGHGALPFPLDVTARTAKRRCDRGASDRSHKALPRAYAVPPPRPGERECERVQKSRHSLNRARLLCARRFCGAFDASQLKNRSNAVQRYFSGRGRWDECMCLFLGTGRALMLSPFLPTQRCRMVHLSLYACIFGDILI